jgi:uncharacterized protein (TIGR03437 family)
MNRSRRRFLKMAAAAGASTGLGRLVHAATLARTPYVQDVRTDRATIMWCTNEPDEAAVEFAQDPAAPRWTRVPARSREFRASQTGLTYTFYQHQADLTGLRPDSRYAYRVLGGGQALGSANAAFVTAPDAGGFLFLAIGDSGMGTPEQNLVERRMAAEPAAFLVHTGDVAYPVGSFTTYQANYFEVYRDIMGRMPFYPCIGNHDVDGDLGVAYKAVHALPADGVPETVRGHYYSFDWGGAHLVSLDATLMLHQNAATAMVQWLERDLARTRKGWRIVFWHHPPYDPARGNGPEATGMRDRVLPILERYGVQLVLNGHAHAYQRTRPMLGHQPVEDGRGIVYVTTGGGGASLHGAPADTGFVVSASVHHYVAVEVQASRLIVRATSATGQELDRLTIAPRPAATRTTVVNAASQSPALAPGTLISVFGQNLGFAERAATSAPLPRELASARLSIGERDLPLTLVSPCQINAQLPFTLPDAATLRITNPNGTSEVALRIDRTAPGIFSAAGPLVALPDGTLLSPSNPARAGDVLTIHAAGLGAVDGEITEGESAPGSPALRARAAVSVEIGGRRLQALFAGLAPGQVGVYHVTAQLPDDLPAGSWALRVIAGEASSNDVAVTVAGATFFTPGPDDPINVGPPELLRM